MTSESTPRLLRVRDWDQHYENSRSREIDRTRWFPVPNDPSADWYVELVTHDDGPAHFGAWHALLMVASRASPRGTLAREDGRPHDAQSLARVTRLPAHLIESAIERLLEIGLVEVVNSKSRRTRRLSSHSVATNRQEGATGSHEGASEVNGIEHHHQERKRKGREQQRTEPDGREGAREESTTEGSDAPSGTSPFSLESDDAGEQPESLYASPEDELKAIYQAKVGEPITIAVLDAIRANLAGGGISMGEFVGVVRNHANNDWRNPAGFLRDLSKRFRTKTRAAPRPKTAAEVAAENYKCPQCASRVPGEGALPGPDGKFVPCACAGAEYISRQRARGVFAGDTGL